MRPLNLPRVLGRGRLREAALAHSVPRQLSPIQNELVELLDAFVETFTRNGARRLDVPVIARAEFFEAQERLDLGDV